MKNERRTYLLSVVLLWVVVALIGYSYKYKDVLIRLTQAEEIASTRSDRYMEGLEDGYRATGRLWKNVTITGNGNCESQAGLMVMSNGETVIGKGFSVEGYK